MSDDAAAPSGAPRTQREVLLAAMGPQATDPNVFTRAHTFCRRSRWPLIALSLFCVALMIGGSRSGRAPPPAYHNLHHHFNALHWQHVQRTLHIFGTPSLQALWLTHAAALAEAERAEPAPPSLQCLRIGRDALIRALRVADEKPLKAATDDVLDGCLGVVRTPVELQGSTPLASTPEELKARLVAIPWRSLLLVVSQQQPDTSLGEEVQELRALGMNIVVKAAETADTAHATAMTRAISIAAWVAAAGRSRARPVEVTELTLDLTDDVSLAVFFAPSTETHAYRLWMNSRSGSRGSPAVLVERTAQGGASSVVPCAHHTAPSWVQPATCAGMSLGADHHSAVGVSARVTDKGALQMGSWRAVQKGHSSDGGGGAAPTTVKPKPEPPAEETNAAATTTAATVTPPPETTTAAPTAVSG